MPEFNLGEVLESAIKGANEAKVMRPGEAELAARAARSAPVAAAPSVPPVEAPPVTVGEPPKMPDIQPAEPATGTPAPTAGDAAASPDAAPAPAAVATDTAAAEPAVAVPPEKVPKPADPANPTAPPEGAPDPAKVPPGPADAKIPPESVQPEPPKVPVAPTEVETAAASFSKAQLGDYALQADHMPNFDVMKTTDDVKAAIAKIAEDNKVQINEARRGVITNDQLQGMADDLNTSTDVVRQVLERESGTTLNAETILASRQLLTASAGRISALAQKIVGAAATDLEKVQFWRQVQFHADFQTQFMGARAEAGRSLNAFGIPTGDSPLALRRISEIMANSGGDIDRLAAAVKMADSTGGIGQLVQGTLWARMRQAGMSFINRIFVNGILSGPPTWLKIGVGNSANTLLNLGDIALAARIGKFLPAGDHVQVGEALANLHGILTASNDALRLGWRVLKTGQSLDSVMRFDPNAIGGIKNVNPAQGVTLSVLPELDKPILGSVIKVMDKVIDAPGSRAVAGIDEVNKTLAYRGFLTQHTLLDIQDQLGAGTLSMEDAAAEMKRMMEDPSPEMQQAAELWAHRMSFQTPLGPVGQKISSVLQQVPVVKLVIPFMKTATNIFKQSIGERTPFALFAASVRNDIAAGGAARDMALSRIASGTAIAGAWALMVTNGIATGAGPQEPKARLLWEANGNRPYSVKVTNPITKETSFHYYGNLEPIASVLGATADAVETGAEVHADEDADTMTDDDTKFQAAAAHITAAIIENTGNKSFMQGVAQFSEVYNDPQRAMQAYTNQMGSAMVPYSAATRFVRNMTDPYLREAWTLTDKIKDNLPGYSKDLAPRPGLFGENRNKNAGSLLGTMSPIPDNPEKYDDVTKELVNVMDATRHVPITLPSKRIDGMRLTSTEWSELVQHARAEPVFANGDTFHDRLESTIASKQYQNATPDMRADLLEHIANQADKLGRDALMKNNPDYAERMTAWQAQKNRLKFNQ